MTSPLVTLISDDSYSLWSFCMLGRRFVCPRQRNSRSKITEMSIRTLHPCSFSQGSRCSYSDEPSSHTPYRSYPTTASHIFQLSLGKSIIGGAKESPRSERQCEFLHGYTTILLESRNLSVCVFDSLIVWPVCRIGKGPGGRKGLFNYISAAAAMPGCP